MLRAIGLSNGLPYNQVTDESEAISAALNLAAGHKPTIDIYIRVGWQVAELSILGPFYIVTIIAS